MSYLRELELALRVVREAGDLALKYFAQETSTFEKEDRSPVTIADRECESLIAAALSEAFPDDGIVGEEGARRDSRSGRRWLVDPIDGTRDFVRRNPFWSVQVGLQDDGAVVAGIIYFPCLNDVYKAALGSGCYYNDTKCAVSDVSELRNAVIMVSGFSSVWRAWPADAVYQLTEQCWTVRCYGGCYDVAMLARGKADIWLAGNGREWDYAPARIIARECGARFFTRDGSDRIDTRNCVICAPALEGKLREILGVGPAAP